MNPPAHNPPSTGSSGSGSDGTKGSTGDGTAGGSGNPGSSSGSGDGQAGSPAGGHTPSEPTSQFVPKVTPTRRPASTSSGSTKPAVKPNPVDNRPVTDFGAGSTDTADQLQPTINLSASAEPEPQVTGAAVPVSDEQPAPQPQPRRGLLAGLLAALGLGAGATAAKPATSAKACYKLREEREKLMAQLGAKSVDLMKRLEAARAVPGWDPIDGDYAALEAQLNALNAGQDPIYEQVKSIDGQLAEAGCP